MVWTFGDWKFISLEPGDWANTELLLVQGYLDVVQLGHARELGVVLVFLRDELLPVGVQLLPLLPHNLLLFRHL